MLENARARGASFGGGGGGAAAAAAVDAIVGRKAGLKTRFRRNVAIATKINKRCVGGDEGAARPRLVFVLLQKLNSARFVQFDMPSFGLVTFSISPDSARARASDQGFPQLNGNCRFSGGFPFFTQYVPRLRSLSHGLCFFSRSRSLRMPGLHRRFGHLESALRGEAKGNLGFSFAFISHLQRCAKPTCYLVPSNLGGTPTV